MTDNDYGVRYTIRAGFKAGLTAEQIVDAMVESGFTPEKAVGMVLAEQESPKMAYIRDDAGNLEDAFLVTVGQWEDLEAQLPEGWTISEE